MPEPISVILPAKNEAASVGALVGAIRQHLPEAEVIVVDDGSSDETAEVARRAGAEVVRHPVSRGNGAAVKSGARVARHPVLAFMDADGQHDPREIAVLRARLQQGYDMVVGARTGAMHAGVGRRLANTIYNRLASWISGVPIADLTSGFRVVRAELFRQVLPLLPNGFSYPTTSTMAFLRAGYNVGFEPVQVQARKQGTTSHIKPLRDGGRFLVIIFRVGSLYSPLKIFLPLSAAFFLLGVGYYLFTFLTTGRFTNLGALLFSTSVLIFLIGLISEQITMLIYVGLDKRHRQD